ncbi:MAG: hypothetical protein ACOZBH_05035 [Patescibacteria group bacterium]
MVEAFQLDFFKQPTESSSIGRSPDKKRLSPEDKKNIQWFWRYFEYKQQPDAVMGEFPNIDTSDLDPQAQKAAERAYYFSGADQYEGLPRYSRTDIRQRLPMKNFKTLPVGQHYSNLRPISEQASLLLLESPRTRQLSWYYAEPKRGNIIELRQFPADFVMEFSHYFPSEVKNALMIAQKDIDNKI